MEKTNEQGRRITRQARLKMAGQQRAWSPPLNRRGRRELTIAMMSNPGREGGRPVKNIGTNGLFHAAAQPKTEGEKERGRGKFQTHSERKIAKIIGETHGGKLKLREKDEGRALRKIGKPESGGLEPMDQIESKRSKLRFRRAKPVQLGKEVVELDKG